MVRMWFLGILFNVFRVVLICFSGEVRLLFMVIYVIVMWYFYDVVCVCVDDEYDDVVMVFYLVCWVFFFGLVVWKSGIYFIILLDVVV